MLLSNYIRVSLSEHISLPLSVFARLCACFPLTHITSVSSPPQPANILVCEDDGEILIKIGDVGTSTSFSTSGGRTSVGTLAYMAPEVKNGEPYSENVDVFSLGITLAEIVFVAMCR